jgi:hypothetical protein
MARRQPPDRRVPALVPPPAGIGLGCLLLGVFGCGAPAKGTVRTTPAAQVAASGADSRTTPGGEAAALWQRRADDAALQRALELWGERLKSMPQDSEAMLALLRALYFAASRDAASNPDSARARHEQALQIADAALARLHPDGAQSAAAVLTPWLAALPAAAVEPLYWRALHALGAAGLSGLARRAFETPRARAALERCLALQPELDHGGPDRALGTLHAQPTDAALRDLARSKAHFDAALKIDAGYPDNHLSYARDWAVAAQDRELFTTQLRAALAPNPLPPAAIAPEAELARAAAERLLRDAANHFE